jgi:hypothetical protein
VGYATETQVLGGSSGRDGGASREQSTRGRLHFASSAGELERVAEQLKRGRSHQNLSAQFEAAVPRGDSAGEGGGLAAEEPGIAALGALKKTRSAHEAFSARWKQERASRVLGAAS